jgi:multiple sugar transport system ATP-binding protein
VLGRKPAQLSGGQRQRVALGRAIVREPKVFLFDEPLSNLDAKLRVETRAELARLHRRLGATVVYVTHDQEEAMTLGGRVAVMRDGFLQQVAPPMELYRRPANRFVAGFVGSPAMNFLPGESLGVSQTPATNSTLGVRPHDIRIVPKGGGDLDAWVDVVEPRGSELLVYLRLGADHNGSELRVVAPPEPAIEPERVVGVKFDRERLHWFEEESGRRVG